MPGSSREVAEALVKSVKGKVGAGYFKKIAGEVGARYLGHGIARVAFLAGGVVIKVAFYTGESNVAEYNLYNKFKDTPVGEYLAKVYEIAEDGAYIVQEYCGETVYDTFRNDFDRDDKCLEVCERIENFMASYGIEADDLHFWNVTAKGKVFDYEAFYERGMWG